MSKGQHPQAEAVAKELEAKICRRYAAAFNAANKKADSGSIEVSLLDLVQDALTAFAAEQVAQAEERHCACLPDFEKCLAQARRETWEAIAILRRADPGLEHYLTIPDERCDQFALQIKRVLQEDDRRRAQGGQDA